MKASVPNGMFGQKLKWNFTKWLCDENGVPIKRYGPKESPFSMERTVAAVLGVEPKDRE